MKIDNLDNIKTEGSDLKVEILLPHFNQSLGEKLLEHTIKELKKSSVKDIKITRVFGALELPYAALKSQADVIIALAIAFVMMAN